MGRALVACTVTVAIGVLPLDACGRDRSGEPPNTDRTTTSAVASDRERQDALDQLRDGYGAPGAVAAVRVGGDQWSGASGAADLDGTALTSGGRFPHRLHHEDGRRRVGARRGRPG